MTYLWYAKSVYRRYPYTNIPNLVNLDHTLEELTSESGRDGRTTEFKPSPLQDTIILHIPKAEVSYQLMFQYK